MKYSEYKKLDSKEQLAFGDALWQVHYAEPKLKPCAHCKSEDIWPGYDINNNHFVICSDCRIHTDKYKSKKEAFAAWNRRNGSGK